MHLAKLGISMLSAMGLLLSAGASAQVVDDTYLIVDDDNSAVSAILEAEGRVFGVELTAMCTSGSDQVVFYSETHHPDEVHLAQRTAKVAQDHKHSPVMIEVQLFPSGVPGFTGSLTDCDSTQLEASLGLNRNHGNFKLQAKNCGTDLSALEIDFVAATCAATRQVTGRYNANAGEVTSLRISGVTSSSLSLAP